MHKVKFLPVTLFLRKLVLKMGFFGSLWEGIKKIGTKIKEFFFPPPPPPPPITTSQTKDTTENIGKSGSYETTTTISEVRDYEKMIRGYLTTYEPKAKKQEGTYKKYVRDLFGHLIDSLRANENFAQSFSLKNFEKEKDRLCDEIDGAIVTVIRSKLSSDNSDCKEILDMDEGDKKKQRMEKFVDETIREAQDNLAKKVSDTMNNIEKNLEELLDGQVEKRERDAKSKANTYDQWESEMENETFDIERAQLPALKKLYAIEQIEKIMAA